MSLMERFETLKGRVLGLSLSPETNKLISDFDKEMEISGSALNTRKNYMKALRNFLFYTKKPLEKTEKEDIMSFLSYAQSKYKEGTVNLHKQTIRKIYKYMNGGEEFPALVKWIQIKKSKPHLPEALPTEEDIVKMANSTDNPRNKAMLLVLYESAMRVGELLAMNIEDVGFDEHGAKIMARGKTGMRRIRLIDSTPDLKLWINNHPFKDNPKHPLWCSFSYKHYGIRITRTTVADVIELSAKRAGIKDKMLNPHSFRHTRLTELAKRGLTEFELKKFAGWEMSSQMSQVYIHLSGSDLDEKILKINGKLINNGKKDKSPMETRKCPICQEENPVTSKFCYGCGEAITEESITKTKRRQKADQIMNLAVKYPEFMKALEDVLRKEKLVDAKTQTKSDL